jgi:hypothetical protein
MHSLPVIEKFNIVSNVLCFTLTDIGPWLMRRDYERRRDAASEPVELRQARMEA